MSTTIDWSTLSEVEKVKAESLGLRGPLVDELENDASFLSEEAKQVLKFHGSYQQEDRDLRKERKKAGLEPYYMFMIRSKLPGGVLTADQYLLHDDLTEKYGDKTLRVTTRQGFQLYGILKGALRSTIRELNEQLVTTLGACGDVVRNVCTCPAPHAGGNREEVIELAKFIRDETLPKSRGYHDIWVEGTKVTTVTEAEPDELYRDRYLPRKFKIAFAFPDDNCTDVYANDLGLVAITEGGRIVGYNVLIGGGFGQTHGKTDTYARLASLIGFVKPDEVLDVTKAVVGVQRDFGDRVNRKFARLKYTIDRLGLDWFRAKVEEYLGRPLAQPVDAPVVDIQDHLGWHLQEGGTWFRGVWIENGRIADRGDWRLRTALRTIVERFRPDVHLTMQHNLLLVGLTEEQKPLVDAILAEHGVIRHEEITPARRNAMACPAIPTCPLAVAESERVLPALIDRIGVELKDLGLEDEELAIRMTGCPNGCARPYTADIAFVGRSLNKYVVYIGGNAEGTRLAAPFADLVHIDQIPATLRPLLARFKEERLPGEHFGDFWVRLGPEALEAAKLTAA